MAARAKRRTKGTRGGTSGPWSGFRAKVLSDAFFEKDSSRRERLGLPRRGTTPVAMMIELNLRHHGQAGGAEAKVRAMWREVGARGPLTSIVSPYLRGTLTIAQARKLIALDAARREEDERGHRRPAIHRIWPDFRIHAHIDGSAATIKADAAQRTFEARGQRIVWAVVDSGIDAAHPHFDTHDTLRGEAARLHRDFTVPWSGPRPPAGEVDRLIRGALEDPLGHGTHVAGIIAGAMPEGAGKGACPVHVFQRTSGGSDGDVETVEERRVQQGRILSGMAPLARLVSLKVLGGDSAGGDTVSNVLLALRYIRETLNTDDKNPLVHGANLSLGYEFDAKWFACGRSPLCNEVDRLVRTGVVVVVSAGNTGYGSVNTSEGLVHSGLVLSINDPGNAELAITVGATHRDRPYSYGVSYFSSKGPTGDGRAKPDLVAPGERITSAAAGQRLDLLPPALRRARGAGRPALYIDESGTSMAAAHVSGAAAAFLSVRREFIGRPDEIKRLFVRAASTLNRTRDFEGAGLLDVMRTIQSI